MEEKEQWIAQMMELIEDYGMHLGWPEHCSWDETCTIRETISNKLREVVSCGNVLERDPIDHYTLSMAHLIIGAVGQLDVTERIVRWTEKYHDIGIEQ